MDQQTFANKIWSVADLLLGDFKQAEYGRIILPFMVLRRLECVLEPTRESVLEQYEAVKDQGLDLDLILPGIAGCTFYTTSKFTLSTLGATNTKQNLEDYISKFSSNVRQVFEQFSFSSWIGKLEEANLLYLVSNEFKDLELHPSVVSNYEMGLVFEHLIRKFAEASNDTAGEFYTPRDVVRLATTLVFSTDQEALSGEGIVRTIYDCAAGTGGFLSSGIELVGEWNTNATIIPYAQELNPETHAICVADKLIQGYDTRNIKFGNTLSNDLLSGETFNYCLANPPFGVDWKKVQKPVNDEHRVKGYAGRFGPGLPRVSDGSMLFLLHLLSKRKPPEEGGTRIGIVLSGSPLFNGGAGSGESEIRRWILENDWLEALVALPTDMFYNTGISTYIWVLSTNKEEHRKGLVQLIDASKISTPMRKNLGSKRKWLNDEQITETARIHDAFEESDVSKIFETEQFGYRRITVERPLQLKFSVTPENIESWANSKNAEYVDELSKVSGEYLDIDSFLKAAGIKKPSAALIKNICKFFGKHYPDAKVICDAKGNPLPDPDLRDYENVPLGEDIDEYFEREVIPHVPDAWIDTAKKDHKDGLVGIVGYEINFNRYFYEYVPPRSLEDIDADLEAVENAIAELLKKVTR
ncbi:N-6 DNA methylase [Denitrovibrio acetiphilus DSM 12809]|jgi:type I restriction enzyme M protein|uniref:site-specific DNA-methyltransferase (adenine-specific) n=1 Tax=Denitrovibrio acetiphilus (strain DSM 12809 / NBRC 114555 / N2460) TaxID=522772 RepID=D4H1I1_DENA2|nr:class I SAM-dependent DNA methyltransferase [Denitrovibrio acetiphilus]ADD68232.1 N-6 DNA methylase [Denitrovibrio acetiphilus DSM 12809]ADD68741.1 N-6 DNA methylase [Denitrovibrio acetiphilus DSM 12809]